MIVNSVKLASASTSSPALGRANSQRPDVIPDFSTKKDKVTFGGKLPEMGFWQRVGAGLRKFGEAINLIDPEPLASELRLKRLRDPADALYQDMLKEERDLDEWRKINDDAYDRL
ncbi:MAG: hypothetical protein PHC64_08545 [Candidatus Gastranaerophilales bacterium]|nr:hypothetical protein [Candidatus Gastranaerophilales bacterium]